MSYDDNERRYAEIMRRIARQELTKRFTPSEPVSATPRHRILNDLNAYDSLSAVLSRKYGRILAYGPQTKHTEGWTAVIGWYRRKGYHGYKLLYLLGLWVVQQDTEYEILLGTKTLPFNAPFYEAEAYQKLIRKTYTTYYQDESSPPTSSGLLYQTMYAPEQRIIIRQAIDTALQQWIADSAT